MSHREREGRGRPCHHFNSNGGGRCPKGNACRFRHPPWSPRTQSMLARQEDDLRSGRRAYAAPYPSYTPYPRSPRRRSRTPPPLSPVRGREIRFREHTPEPPSRPSLLQRMNMTSPTSPISPISPPTAPRAHRRTGEPERAEGLLGRIDRKSPKQVVTDGDGDMPAQARQPSTLPSQAAQAAQAATNMVQPAKAPDPTKPALSSSHTPAPASASASTPAPAPTPGPSMDDMEVEQSANPPSNTLLDESNRQTPTHPGQEKVDAATRHHTALKEIWAQRVFYLDLIRVDTEVLRESQEILESIPLSVDQRQKLESAVLSLQGRIQECNQRLIEDELRLEKSLETDKTHGAALEDLMARLECDEQVVAQWIEDKKRQDKPSAPELLNTDAVMSASSPSSSGREDINDKLLALQDRLDDMHQLATFDNDSFREMVHAELHRAASRSKAKNVLDATELYSLELLEEEFKDLVEKLDEGQHRIQVLEARGDARAAELRKWMEEDARDEEQILRDRLEADELNTRTEVIVEGSPVASITAALQPYVDAWKAQTMNALDYNILNSTLPARRHAHLEQLRATQEEYEAGLAKLLGDQKDILEREKMEHTKRVIEQMLGVKAFNERIIEMLNVDTARTSLPGP